MVLGDLLGAAYKMETDRADGRKANQLRPLACSRNVLNRAHGSASWSQGACSALICSKYLLATPLYFRKIY